MNISLPNKKIISVLIFSHAKEENIYRDNVMENDDSNIIHFEQCLVIKIGKPRTIIAFEENQKVVRCRTSFFYPTFPY